MAWIKLATLAHVTKSPLSANDPLQSKSNRWHPTWQVGEIPKSSPRRTHCKLWVFFFDTALEPTSPNTAAATCDPHGFTNLWIILPSYAVIRFLYMIHYVRFYLSWCRQNRKSWLDFFHSIWFGNTNCCLALFWLDVRKEEVFTLLLLPPSVRRGVKG